ncbi:MAG: HAMP domain-containing histidine kinase [Lachnospiraceae bacterium]|nr:HAMP domain-containing histidine kinase [Lachnospiraceae bacterium]
MTKLLRKRIFFTMMLLLSITFISIIFAINIWSRSRNTSEAESNLRFIMQREFKPDNPDSDRKEPPANNPEVQGSTSSETNLNQTGSTTTANASTTEDKSNNPAPPDNRPEPDDRHQEIATAHFILAHYSQNDTLVSIHNSLSDTYTDEEIETYCNEILASGNELGTIAHLRYLVQTNDAGSIIALMDYSAEEQTNNQLLLISGILGGIGLILFGFLSYILSGLMVRPVTEAFDKQRQFISDASHELKTPIAVILSNSELLSDTFGENRQLSYIKQECDRMHHLVTSLLTLTRLEQTPDKELEKSDFCISDALLERILPMESIAFEKGIVMESDICPDLTFYGVKEQIQQLAGILIDNALTYTSPQGQIQITLKKESHHLVFTVSNTGDEIPEAERIRLFERFYRSDKARSRATGHFGLGLSIAQSIVANHKGHIHVESANGMNSFIVSLRQSDNHK